MGNSNLQHSQAGGIGDGKNLRIPSSMRSALKSNQGKLLKGVASLFTLTLALAVSATSKMAAITADGVIASTSEWLKNAFSGQSSLFNSHNSFGTAISKFFHDTSNGAFAIGTYGLAQGAQFIGQEIQNAQNEGGMGTTALDGDDATDFEVKRGDFLKNSKKKLLENQDPASYFFITLDEWLKKGEKLLEEYPHLKEDQDKLSKEEQNKNIKEYHEITEKWYKELSDTIAASFDMVNPTSSLTDYVASMLEDNIGSSEIEDIATAPDQDVLQLIENSTRVIASKIQDFSEIFNRVELSDEAKKKVKLLLAPDQIVKEPEGTQMGVVKTKVR